jgi:hypothetical protein
MITDKEIQAALKQKVALYKYSTDDGRYSWVSVSQYREDKKEVRLSDPVEIHFRLRTDSDILSK